MDLALPKVTLLRGHCSKYKIQHGSCRKITLSFGLMVIMNEPLDLSIQNLVPDLIIDKPTHFQSLPGKNYQLGDNFHSLDLSSHI